MNCPKCGAKQMPVLPNDGNHIEFTCGTHGWTQHPARWQSDLCCEAEEHNETRRKLEVARQRLKEILSVPFNGGTDERVMLDITIDALEETK